MDDTRLNEIAAEIDRAVPKEGAKVACDFDHGGIKVVANRQGLIRLGLECLIAAGFPLPSNREVINRDWNYLFIGKHGKPTISSISRTDNVELAPPPSDSRLDKVKNGAVVLIMLAVLLFMLSSMVVGCITILEHV